jgi:hypothetical protein
MRESRVREREKREERSGLHFGKRGLLTGVLLCLDKHIYTNTHTHKTLTHTKHSHIDRRG